MEMLPETVNTEPQVDGMNIPRDPRTKRVNDGLTSTVGGSQDGSLRDEQQFSFS